MNTKGHPQSTGRKEKTRMRKPCVQQEEAAYSPTVNVSAQKNAFKQGWLCWTTTEKLEHVLPEENHWASFCYKSMHGSNWILGRHGMANLIINIDDFYLPNFSDAQGDVRSRTILLSPRHGRLWFLAIKLKTHRRFILAARSSDLQKAGVVRPLPHSWYGGFHKWSTPKMYGFC